MGAAIALGAGVLVVQAVVSPLSLGGSGTGRWSSCRAARPGGGGCRSCVARCGRRPGGSTIARGDRRREEPDRWLPDRLARLGVRSPARRDAVAAAALAVLGFGRAVVALVVNRRRLPVPAWRPAAYVQTRRAYTAELVARAERLELGQQERARPAVVEERRRIARELHNIAGPST